ncbi:hypothetical protein HMI54_006495, partial [Coelomomyces lativittatus]
MIKNPTMILDAITTCWIAYTTSFDFDLEHIDQEQNVLANALTRQGAYSDDEEGESDIEEYLDCVINENCYMLMLCLRVLKSARQRKKNTQNHWD